MNVCGSQSAEMEPRSVFCIILDLESTSLSLVQCRSVKKELNTIGYTLLLGKRKTGKDSAAAESQGLEETPY